MATYDNDQVIQFPTPTGAWNTPTHFGAWTSSSGGTLRGGSLLGSTVSAPAIGADVEFAAGALDIEIPDGEFTSDGAEAAIEGFIGSSLWISLHTGSPSSSNELSGGSYARVQVTSSNWSAV